VARGGSLRLELPDGVYVPLSAGQPITITQVVRNDYWKGTASPFYNSTTGDVVVNFYPAASAVSAAAPFIDTQGTQALFVPPRAAGQTGGVWHPASPVAGAVVGLWTDPRMIEASIADAAAATVKTTSNSAIASSYETLADAPPALAYQCTHSNGFTTTTSQSTYGTEQYEGTLSLFAAFKPVARPFKFACLETKPPAAGVPPVPSGKPLLAGGTPPKNCVRSIHSPVNDWINGSPAYDDSQCVGSAVDNCATANLVGGQNDGTHDGVDDGRCSLIGLAW
jgi:hypothetical protein